MNLDYAEVTIWSRGVFGLGQGTLEALVEPLGDFDFAALVLTPDDITTGREETEKSPRDNVLLDPPPADRQRYPTEMQSTDMPTKFPMLSGDDNCFVTVCPSCGRDATEFGGLFSFQGGAHLMTEDRRSGGPSDQLAGYLMTFMQKTINGTFVEQQNMIVDNIRGGQFNIFWCSLACMRQSLNDIVDQLERQLKDRCEPDEARESPT